MDGADVVLASSSSISAFQPKLDVHFKEFHTVEACGLSSVLESCLTCQAPGSGDEVTVPAKAPWSRLSGYSVHCF